MTDLMMKGMQKAVALAEMKKIIEISQKKVIPWLEEFPSSTNQFFVLSQHSNQWSCLSDGQEKL